MRIQALLQSALGLALLFAGLFVSAGSWNWMAGRWCMRSLGMAWSVGALSLFLYNRKLFFRRTQAGQGSQHWDRGLVSLMQLSFLLLFVVGGLDTGRQNMPIFWPLFAAGLLLLWSGLAVIMACLFANPFFETTVRHQECCGQYVVQRGVYGWLRHPGYLGFLLVALAIPTMLGSLWATLPWLSLAMLLRLRVEMEEVYLCEHLPGYQDYCARVPHRMIPFLW